MTDASLDDRLATAIEDDPDDVENYRVYADHLDGNGDPRGPLIAMMIMLERLPAAKREHLIGKIAAHFDQHRATFCPPGLPRVDGNGVARGSPQALRWRYGFAHRVALYGYGEEVEELAALLAHPSGRFLVGIDARIGSETGGVIDLLRDRRPRALRELALDIQAACDLAPLWPALARLHALSLRHAGRFALDLGAVAAPALRRLALAGELPVLEPLLSAPWPALERLDLELPDLRLADLRRVFAREDAPALTGLRLVHNPFTDDICRELPATPLGARLRRLELPDGMMTDAGARTLAAGLAALNRPPLEEIRVTGNRLTRAGLAALGAIAAVVTG